MANSGEVAAQIRAGVGKINEASAPLNAAHEETNEMNGEVQAAKTSLDGLLGFFNGLADRLSTAAGGYQAGHNSYTEGAGLIVSALEGANHEYAQTARNGCSVLPEHMDDCSQAVRRAEADLDALLSHLSEAATLAEQIGSALASTAVTAETVKTNIHPETTAAAELYAGKL